MSVIFAEASKERHSVYLVANRGPTLDSPTAFKEKGLAAFAPEKPEYLEFHGGKKAVSIAHDLYVANLAAIMYSSVYNVVNPSVYRYYNLMSLVFTEKFIGTPDIAISFSKQPDLEMKETMGKLGFSQQEHRNMLQFIGKSSVDIVKAALEQSPQIDIATPYAVSNIRGFMAFTTTVKMITSFVKVNWEAAKNFSTTVALALHPDDGAKNFPSYTTKSSMGKPTKFDDSDKKFTQLLGVGVNDNILVMSRAQEGLSSAYGPGDKLPEAAHNMVFPYFDGMQLPDWSYPVRIIQQVFFYNLGAEFEKCTDVMNNIRKGWKSLSTTEHGKALSHMLQGIDLSLQIGCQLYLVIEAKKYVGFVLQSTDAFWAGVRGKQVTSYVSTQAKIDLQLANAHTKALSMICKILSESVITGSTDKKIIKRSDITSARQLYAEVMKRSFDRANTDELQKWADYLNFPQEFTKVNPATLVALYQAFGDDKAFGPEIPMYLGGGMIVNKNLAMSLCAAFGVNAPSLLMPKGETCKIPKPGSGVDASIVGDKDGRAHMGFIAVYMKNLKSAAHDLEETFKKREVTFRRGVKGGAAKCSYQFVGSNKDEIWTPLADAVDSWLIRRGLEKAAKNPKDKGKKRATEEPEAEGSKKARLEDFSAYF